MRNWKMSVFGSFSMVVAVPDIEYACLYGMSLLDLLYFMPSFPVPCCLLPLALFPSSFSCFSASLFLIPLSLSLSLSFSLSLSLPPSLSLFRLQTSSRSVLTARAFGLFYQLVDKLGQRELCLSSCWPWLWRVAGECSGQHLLSWPCQSDH